MRYGRFAACRRTNAIVFSNCATALNIEWTITFVKLGATGHRPRTTPNLLPLKTDWE